MMRPTSAKLRRVYRFRPRVCGTRLRVDFAKNANDLRSVHGDRGVRFRIAHAKDAKGGKVCERQY